MENRAYAIAAGLFVVLLTALLFAGAFWLGGGAPRGLPYDLITEASVAALSPGALVRLRGVEVGRVQSIGFDPKDSRRVRVRALVDPSVQLKSGTYAMLKSQGISGTDYVELDYPDSATQVLETSVNDPARIDMRASGLLQLTDSSDELIKTFTDTLRRVDALLTPETEKRITHLLAQIDEAAAQLTSLAHDLHPAVRGIPGVVAETRTTLQDADSLILGVRSRLGALDALGEGARGTGEAARNVEHALIDQTLPRLDSLADRISRNSDTLDQLLHQLEDQPQSLVFGSPPTPPGPGERGFSPAASR